MHTSYNTFFRVLRPLRSVLGAIFLAALLVSLVAWLFPLPLSRQLRAVPQVDLFAVYAYPLSPGDTLRFVPSTGATTTAQGDTLCADTLRGSGVWISYHGQMLAASARLADVPQRLTHRRLQLVLEKELARLTSLDSLLRAARSELQYYERTHSVVDDGYNDVMAFSHLTVQRAARVDAALLRVRRALAHADSDSASAAQLRVSGCVTTCCPYEDVALRTCQPLTLLRRSGDLLLLQTRDCAMPLYAERAYINVLPAHPFGENTLGYLSPAIPRAEVLPPDLAAQLGSATLDGAPRFNASGSLRALHTSRGEISSRRVQQFVYDYEGFLARTWHNLRDATLRRFRIATLPQVDTLNHCPLFSVNIKNWFSRGDLYTQTTLPQGHYVGALRGGKPSGFGQLRYADGGVYQGGFLSGIRQGEGIYSQGDSVQFVGTWNADTLVTGTRTVRGAQYVGGFSSRLQPQGKGRDFVPSQGWYFGDYADGARCGFGFSVGEKRIVRCGTWRKGTFTGERMVYTADRVYGIDISRYQHEIGRRVYPIDWRALRITRLTAGGQRRTLGRTDYPVRFAYIKATQGVRVTNRYYAADAAAARHAGVRVGAYHFFSTSLGAQAQVDHFLATARPAVGDLPPMLDLEPFDSQIAAAGGIAAVFQGVLHWLRRVELATGAKPVLYVGQRFVNKYLPDAPAALHDYPVWVARYGEYKPYVPLLYWQVSPEGRVQGIHGDVDINVFNGTLNAFKEYAQAARVTRAQPVKKQQRKSVRPKRK